MTWNLTAVSLLIPLLFLLIGLAVFVVIDPYISWKHRRVMLIIIVLSASLIVQNIWEDYLSAGPLRWGLRTTLAVYGYTIRPVFPILFLYIIRPEKKYLGCWGLAILNWAVHMTAFFSHLCFWIDEYNHYQGGPLSRACLIISLILLAYWLFESLRDYRNSRKQDIIIPVLVVLMIIVSVSLDDKVGFREQPITFLTFAIVISSMFYYIWLHLRFVREHEDDLKAQQRMQIMLSQIQPHFLFNSLEVIRRLYRKDPAQADAALLKFERYLRGNMDSLTQKRSIPFEEELTQTRLYLELEALRFPGELHVVYDLSCTDFLLPPLTLQPLAENAVRHGIRGKKSGEGTVTISTRAFPDRYEIVVADDGPGFDPDALPQDGAPHIGLANVRERLRYAGASLWIGPRPGGGTEATIVIPRTGEKGGA